jgi:mono/diheme cytochrome c family protein/cytochrome c553
MGNFKFKKHYLIIAAMGVVFPLAFQNCSQLGSDETAASYSGLSESDVLEQKAMLVLQNNCVSCHNADIPSQGVDLTDVSLMLLVGVVIPNEAGQSPLMQVLNNPTLAEHGVLKQKDINALSKWITEGFKEDFPVDVPNTTPIPLGPNWASLKQNIFSKKCSGCHNAGSGRVNLTTFAGVLSRINPGNATASNLYRRVSGLQPPTMPLNIAPLSNAEIAAIEGWINAGALEN